MTNRANLLKMIALALMILGLILIFSDDTHCQERVRPMLGEGEARPLVMLSEGPALQTNGFDRVKKKKIMKTVSWLSRHGYSIGAQFEQAASEVGDMESHINDSIRRSKAVYRACGEKVDSIDWSMVRITVEALPFPVAGYEAGQLFSGVTDGDHIRIVVFHARESNWLQDYRSLTFWEANNYAMCKLQGCPRTIEEEVRAQQPCGRN